MRIRRDIMNTKILLLSTICLSIISVNSTVAAEAEASRSAKKTSKSVAKKAPTSVEGSSPNRPALSRINSKDLSSSHGAYGWCEKSAEKEK